MAQKINNETIFLLDERGLCRSKEMIQKKKASESTTYFKFLDIIKLELGDQKYIIKPNDYPYDVYCGEDLEHFVLWSKISDFEIQEIINSIANLHSYWENPTILQSLADPEIKHIHLFIKVENIL